MCDIANMDQTPLPFILDDEKTYTDTNDKDVICKTGLSGLDKRQCTLQITIFADGVPRVKPLHIFRGKGMRITKKERESWDKRVSVTFQENAWCNEKVMLEWIRKDWACFYTNKPTPSSTGKILIADIHRGQQTDAVKALLVKAKTVLQNIPGGLTSYLQVVDVIVNKPLKESIRIQSEKHLNDNSDKYTSGKITASERRVLITNWCGNAWSRVDKDSIVRGFKKLGLSVELDGSESTLRNIPKLPMYKMSDMMDENAEYVVDDSDAESEVDDIPDMEDDDMDGDGGNECGEENECSDDDDTDAYGGNEDGAGNECSDDDDTDEYGANEDGEENGCSDDNMDADFTVEYSV